MQMFRKFVRVTWTDACLFTDKKLKDTERATLPLKITYGWVFGETDTAIKIVHEELLPDEGCEREYSFTLIPKRVIQKVELIRKLQSD